MQSKTVKSVEILSMTEKSAKKNDSSAHILIENIKRGIEISCVPERRATGRHTSARKFHKEEDTPSTRGEQ